MMIVMMTVTMIAAMKTAMKMKTKTIMMQKMKTIKSKQMLSLLYFRVTVKILVLSAEIYPKQDIPVCGWRLYTTIGSEKLFSQMSDVMVQIFQKILPWKFECISNLLYRLWNNFIVISMYERCHTDHSFLCQKSGVCMYVRRKSCIWCLLNNVSHNQII